MNPQAPRIPIEPLRWDPGDPLATEHELVSRLVSEMLKMEFRLYYAELDLDLTEPGRAILAADPDACARIAMVLVAHASHYENLGEQAKALQSNEMARINWHLSPEWKLIWPPRQICAGALRRLMKRKLPLTADHLTKLANWIASSEWHSDSLFPLKAFIKAVESHGEIKQDETELRTCLKRVAGLLRFSRQKDMPKLAHQIELLLGNAGETLASQPDSLRTVAEPASPIAFLPAPAGSPTVLVRLKQYLGTAPQDTVATSEIGFDHFPLREDSPLIKEREYINMFLPEVVERSGYNNPNLSLTDTGRLMLASDEAVRGRILLAAAERIVNTRFVPGGGIEDHRCWQSQYAVHGVFNSLLKTMVKFDRNGLFDFLLFLSARVGYQADLSSEAVQRFLTPVEEFAAESTLTAGERHVLHRLRCQSVRTCPFGHPSPEAATTSSLLGDNLYMVLVPGEAWSDAVNLDVARLAPSERPKWVELFGHASTASASRPSAKWVKTAREIIKDLGAKEFAEALKRWFPLEAVS